MIPWVLMALIACVKCFHRVDSDVCVWRGVCKREQAKELCWQEASCSRRLDKCLLELFSSSQAAFRCFSLTTCCLLKSIKMSQIQIHKHWFMDLPTAWLEPVKPNEYIQPVRLSWQFGICSAYVARSCNHVCIHINSFMHWRSKIDYRIISGLECCD